MRQPRVARWLIALVVDAEDREYLLRDMEEELERVARQRGKRAARMWYRSQVVRSLVPSLGRRWQLARRRRTARGRNHRGTSVMDSMLQDVRYAVRTLLKRPAFTVVAVTTLALGIGANTTIFSLVNAVLFKGVPAIEDTDGLVEVTRMLEGRHFDISYPVFRHIRDQSATLADAAAFSPLPVSISGDDNPSVHMAMMVTGNYLPLLGLSPTVGRFFASDESFHPDVQAEVVISHRLWQAEFGGTAGVVGKTIRLNGYPVEIVGVTPPSFRGHVAALVVDVFVPLGVIAPGLHTAGSLDGPSNGIIEVIGRLRPGVGNAVAAEALSTAADQYQQEFNPGTASDYVLRITSWGPVPGVVRGGVTAFFAVLMVLVGLVLMMACINVTNMLLSRTTERRGELAVRLALGADRHRLVRQLVTEALVLFVVAGVVGLLLSTWVSGLLMSLKPPLPQGFSLALDLAPDWRVMGFALGIAVAAGIVFSLAPALRSARHDLVPALKDNSAAGAPLRARLRTVLVSGQMAVTVLLLIAAGLFLRSLTSMQSLDPGWNATGVVGTSIDLELAGYDRARGKALQRDLVERVAALPGVTAVSLARKLPLASRSSLGDINVAGVPAPEGRGGYDAYFNTITADYFHTLDLQLIEGRSVNRRDTEGQQPVAVINQAMADRFWPDGDALGRRFFAGPVGSDWAFTVIGVVENAKYRRLDEETANFYYLPFSQRYNAQAELLVRTTPGQGTNLASAIRGIFRELDPGLPVQPIQPLASRLEVFLLPQRLAAWVAGVMGLIGLALGAVGVYGVTAFAVGQRTKEIGLRIALGASANNVLRTMTVHGLQAPLMGLAAGLVAGAALSQLLSRFLAGVRPLDPVTFGVVVPGLFIVASIAVLVPVRRAAKLNPVDTLRAE